MAAYVRYRVVQENSYSVLRLTFVTTSPEIHVKLNVCNVMFGQVI